jgi:hypothetical protein
MPVTSTYDVRDHNLSAYCPWQSPQRCRGRDLEHVVENANAMTLACKDCRPHSRPDDMTLIHSARRLGPRTYNH